MTQNFYKNMRDEIFASLADTPHTIKGNYKAWFKFVFFLSGVIIPYLLIIQNIYSRSSIIVLCAVMISFIVFLMLNVLHDVMHGSFSHHPVFKRWVSYLLDIIGPSSFVWKIKHNVSHHTFTNHSHLDNDLNVSTILRFSTNHKRLPIHRFQHLYISPLYFLQCFFWFYISDFKHLIRGKIASKKIQGFNNGEKFLFLFNKILHVTIALIIPASVFGIKSAVCCYILVYGLLGFLLALIFQVAHIFENTNYNLVEKFENQDHWAKIQLEGSCVFAPESKIGDWLYGGLQYQAIHHLFPDISHVHFEKIYPIVKKHCEQNNIHIKTFPSLFSAICSHYKQLYLLGHGKAVGDNFFF